MRRIKLSTAIALVCACLLAVFTTGCSCDASTDEPKPIRTVYDIDMVLETASLDEEHTAVKLRETLSVTVINDSGDAWEELCFRDYMQSVIDEARTRTDAQLDYTSGITGAARAGKPLSVRVDETDASRVYVALDEPLHPGGVAVIELSYESDIPDGGFRCSWLPFIFENTGCTYELAQFYPMLAVYENGDWVCDDYFIDGECFYTRCADYNIDLTVPSGCQVIASGDENRVEDGSDNWRITAQNMRDVTIIVSDEFELLTGEIDGVTVNSWYCGTPENSSDHRRQGEVSLQAAMDAVAAFTEAYGEYPYSELDVTESHYEFGGMEAPGLVRISLLYSWFIRDKDTKEDREEYLFKLRSTVAHEVAHEWFYAVVGNDQYNEAWLDESFAAFSEQVYWRSMGRSEEDIAAQMAELANALPESGDITVDRAYDQLDTETTRDYIKAVYKRGAAFLYKLEQAMGQEEFYSFMKEYYSAYSFREADTVGFIGLISPHIEGNGQAQALLSEYLLTAAQ